MDTDGGSSSKKLLSGLHRVLEELGLVSLYHSTADVKLLCLQRFVRLFAYGGSTLVLVSFLQELQISKTRIGLFMTLTLAGDVAISFVLSLCADRVGRRAILGVGAALMVVSGVVFALADNYWLLLVAAVLGVISPSGNEVGPFRAVEESTVAHLTDAKKRSDIYAWYSLLGTAGTAFGIMTCGWAIHYLHGDLRWSLEDSYRVIFYLYAALGAVKGVLALMLSRAAEMDEPEPQPSAASSEQDGERRPLLQNAADEEESATRPPEESSKTRRRWLPDVSPESVKVITTLAVLFALDNLASGLAPMTWVTYYFRSHYNIEEGKLGSIFFVTSIIAAVSTIVASSLAKRFGNVNTMVFTHLPSAVFLALIPIPDEVHLSIMFLVLRACTQSMDVAPRSAFLAAILKPSERTAVMGLINVVKTTSQSCGPLLTGILADHNVFWVAFVCAGSLKACYDLGFLFLFKNHEAAKTSSVSDEERQEHR